MLYSIRSFKYILNLNNITGNSKAFQFLFDYARRQCKSEYKLVTRKIIQNTPKIMKFDSPQFQSCLTGEVKILEDLFTKKGYEIRIVGGAVRDLLMGIQPEDLDFSTTATPCEMKTLFTENNIRLINTNGEKHGTITCRINERNFEITTLRIDLATNGRHAEVQFTTNWILDANRRDLTINAMYLGLDGTLYDYFNGYEDLKSKRLLFVGDATTRIQEDYLRILRYFRFYGRIAEAPGGYDEDILKAIRENADGLNGISGERIWIELNKVLTGKFVDDIILKMINLGIGKCLSFPSKPNEAEFKRVVDRLKLKDIIAKPMTILSALFNNEEEINEFYLRVKPSNFERELGYFILRNRKGNVETDLRQYKMLLINRNRPNGYVHELLKYEGKFDYLEELKEWVPPDFPVKGNMLKKLGIQGKDIGEVINHLKEIWCNHDFDISAEELLEHVPKKKKKVN